MKSAVSGGPSGVWNARHKDSLRDNLFSDIPITPHKLLLNVPDSFTDRHPSDSLSPASYWETFWK